MDPWGVRGSTNQQPTLNTLTFINEKESLKRDTAAGKKVVDERYWKEEEEKKSRWHKVGWPLRWHKSPCLQVCGTALRALFSALLRRPRAQMGSSHFKNIFVASSPDISSKARSPGFSWGPLFFQWSCHTFCHSEMWILLSSSFPKYDRDWPLRQLNYRQRSSSQPPHFSLSASSIQQTAQFFCFPDSQCIVKRHLSLEAAGLVGGTQQGEEESVSFTSVISVHALGSCLWHAAC